MQLRRSMPVTRITWVFARLYLAIFHGLTTRGMEHRIRRGPAIIASNHQSFLDPVVLAVPGVSPPFFMAQAYLFRVPIFGPFIRLLGAFSVDPEKPVRETLRRSLEILEEGGILAVFPEGSRGVDEGSVAPLQEGVARIAVRSGAPILPATVMGGVRAWHRDRPFPVPGRLRLSFHPPIVPEKGGGRAEVTRITSEMARRIGGPLGPSSRALRRIDRLYERPAPPLRLQELLVLILGAALLGLGMTGISIAILVGAMALFAGYLLADIRLLRPGRASKYLRDASPLIALGAIHPIVSTALPRMGGGWLPLAAFILPAGVQAIWSGQPRGLRWVLGTVLIYASVVASLHLGAVAAPGWAIAALSLAVFQVAHSAVSPRLGCRRAIAAGLALAGLGIAAFLPDGGMGDLGVALATGAACFLLSRFVPSGRRNRGRRHPAPDRHDRSPPRSRG